MDAWLPPPRAGGIQLLSSELNGSSPENSYPSDLARRVSVQERRGPDHLRRQGDQPALAGAVVFSGRRGTEREDRISASRGRRRRLHGGRQRKGSPRAREQPDQAEEAALQHSAARRQNLSLHQADHRRAVSTSVSDAPVAQGRIALLRPVLPYQPGVPTGRSDPPALHDSVVQARPESLLPAAVLAVLHRTLPGTVCRRADNAGALQRSRAGCEAVSRGPWRRSVPLATATNAGRSRTG